MTKYEEALKVMKQQREEAGQAFLGVVQFNAPQYYAVIEALEKQIPKKPTQDECVEHIFYCPNCTRFFIGFHLHNGYRKPHHCICGQALDWSE